MFPLKIIKRVVADCKNAAIPPGSANINISSSSHTVPSIDHVGTTARSDDAVHDYATDSDDSHDDYSCSDYDCPSDSDASVVDDAEYRYADFRIEIMRKDIEISAMHSRNGALLNEMAAQKDENVALVNRMAAQKDENVALLNEMVALKDDLDKANNVVSEVTEALQCPICIDTFTSPHVLRCGHTYCQECLVQWFSRSKHCPSCRSPVYSPPIPSILVRNIISCTVGEAPANSLSPPSSALGTSSQDDPWRCLFFQPPPRAQTEANDTHTAPAAISNPVNPANATRVCVSCNSPFDGNTTLCRTCSGSRLGSGHSDTYESPSAIYSRILRETQERRERVQRFITAERIRAAQREAAATTVPASRLHVPTEQTSGSSVHSSVRNDLNNVQPSAASAIPSYLSRIRDTSGDTTASLLRQTQSILNPRPRIPVSTPVRIAASSSTHSTGSTSASSRSNIPISRILGHSAESSSSSYHEVDVLDRAINQMVSEDASRWMSTHGRNLNVSSGQTTFNSSSDAAVVPGSGDIPSRVSRAQVLSRSLSAAEAASSWIDRYRIPLDQLSDSSPSGSVADADHGYFANYDAHMRELTDRLYELTALDFDDDDD